MAPLPGFRKKSKIRDNLWLIRDSIGLMYFIPEHTALWSQGADGEPYFSWRIYSDNWYCYRKSLGLNCKYNYFS